MEYIQCSHCQKKYRVNAQVRAAVGRMVACKDCGQPIEIVILNDESDTPPPTKPETSAPPAKKEKSEPAPKRAPRKHHIKKDKPEKKYHLVSILLGSAIVLASLYVFFQGRSQQARDLNPPTHTEKLTQLAQATDEHHRPDSEAETRAQHTQHSTACKEAAAEQWLIDFSMSHGQQQGSEYMQLLDRGIQNSAQVRQYCGGSHMVAEILQSAQAGETPDWLQHTIHKLTHPPEEKIPHF